MPTSSLSFKPKNKSTFESRSSAPTSNRNVKRNSSILSFFKKSDSPLKQPKPSQTRITEYTVRKNGKELHTRIEAEGAGLFVGDEPEEVVRGSSEANTHDTMTQPSGEVWIGQQDISQDDYTDLRYNENSSTLKRRRIEIGTVSVTTTGTPTATSPVGPSITNELRQGGPFLDESDSEHDVASEVEDQKGVDTSDNQIGEVTNPEDERQNDYPNRGTTDSNNNEPKAVILEDEVSVCPICRNGLDGLTEIDASVHVNDCLDRDSSCASEVDNHATPLLQPVVPASNSDQKAIAQSNHKRPFNLSVPSSSASAFTKLMSGNAEDTAWRMAAANEHASRGKPASERTCPFYKILPGLSISVDAFRYGAIEGCSAYFLTHYHSDHYGGLTASWSHGPIFCSRITASLIKQQINVKSEMIVELEFEVRTEVPRTNGVHVTMIPANHCPGSSLFLFEKNIMKGQNPSTHRILHCGDFRATPQHIQHHLLRPNGHDTTSNQSAQQRLDVCYLDTTYLNPKYAFPDQQDVISACSQLCKSLNQGHHDTLATARKRLGIKIKSLSPRMDEQRSIENVSRGLNSKETCDRLLIVIGTYSIGKERICIGIAQALKSKIYASAKKQRILRSLEDEELSGLLTLNPLEAQVHMQSLMDMRTATLSEYLNSFKPHFARIVGFRPTGWNYRPPAGRIIDSPSVFAVLHSDAWKAPFSAQDLIPQRGSNKEISCYSVPYSEHSSFRELTMFCCALRISRIIPTVNVGSPGSREKMKAWIAKCEMHKQKAGLYRVEEGALRW
ncbi:hypothetical protein FQN57_000342 [Myotisia sp. PD_48]|nr:hypothetical protein FQN57_000342 [Myotisia sp. PD_48]